MAYFTCLPVYLEDYSPLKDERGLMENISLQNFQFKTYLSLKKAPETSVLVIDLPLLQSSITAPTVHVPKYIVHMHWMHTCKLRKIIDSNSVKANVRVFRTALIVATRCNNET